MLAWQQTAVSLKLPEFWEPNAGVRVDQAGAQFALRDIAVFPFPGRLVSVIVSPPVKT